MTNKSIEDLLKEKKIETIVNNKVLQAEPTISIGEATKLMVEARSGYVILVENKKVVGIFTETDITRKILNQSVDSTEAIQNYMTKDPSVLCPSDTVGAAIDLMAKKSIYHLPLVDKDGLLVGMLSVRSLIRFLTEYYPDEVYNLPPNPRQITTTTEGG